MDRIPEFFIVYPVSMRHVNSVDRKESGCPFCEMPEVRVVSDNELAYAVRDAFPVTVLHTLVIPKRHVRGYFELDDAEHEAPIYPAVAYMSVFRSGRSPSIGWRTTGRS